MCLHNLPKGMSQDVLCETLNKKYLTLFSDIFVHVNDSNCMEHIHLYWP